ncbi:MAG: TolC family protein [Oscillibacter sp.]|nr:TolC family protein [Oscillibacter sp.]
MNRKIIALALTAALTAGLCGISVFAEQAEGVPQTLAETVPADSPAGPDNGADYTPDPVGQASFSAVEQRIRRNNLQALALDMQIAALESIDYEDYLEDLRRGLNQLAGVQWMMLDMGQGSSYSYAQLDQSYTALRAQFDAIRDGDLQKDNAGVIRQLENVKDQLVMGGETMYLAILSMESQEDSLERQLTALDRTLKELRLRHELGHISTLQLKEAEAGRSALVSGLETLRMNLRVYKTQLEVLMGAEQTGSIRLGGVPQVTQAQLSAMDLEKDLASAKEASYELFDAHKTYKDTQDAYHGLGAQTPMLDAEYGWPAAQYTYNNAVQNYELKFRTLYAQVKDYKQVLEAAKVTLSSKEDAYAAADLKYQQGNLSKNAFLSAAEEVVAAEEAVRSAENDLFTAYNSYCWAAESGILN